MKNFKLLLNVFVVFALSGFMGTAANAQQAKAQFAPVEANVVIPQHRSNAASSKVKKTAPVAKQNAPAKNYLKANATAETTIVQLVSADANSNTYSFKNTKWNKEGMAFIAHKANAAKLKGLIKMEVNELGDMITIHLDKNNSKAAMDHIFTAIGHANYQIKS